MTAVAMVAPGCSRHELSRNGYSVSTKSGRSLAERTKRQGIVKLGNLLAFSPPRTTANLLICGLGVGRARLKIAEICLNLTMPDARVARLPSGQRIPRLP